MLGIRTVSNIITSLKNYVRSLYYSIINLPHLCKTKIISCQNYINDFLHRLKNLTETNCALGVEHLYKNNLNDAILRFKMVDKFFMPGHKNSNYWLGWVYFIKNNYEKSLLHLDKAADADEVGLRDFIKNYENCREIPAGIYSLYKDLTASIYATKFNRNNINLPQVFVNRVLDKIVDLPDHYNILEIGSNVGLVGYEVRKRFPDNFALIAIESSNIMNNLLGEYHKATHLYDQLLNIDLPELIKTNSSKYDVILSFCSLSFSSDIEYYVKSIYDMLEPSGYFAFCVPVRESVLVEFEPSRNEFIFNSDKLGNIVDITGFTILGSEKFSLVGVGKYYMLVCRRF